MVMSCLFGLSTIISAHAFEAGSGPAQAKLETARSRYEKEPSNGQAAWQYARACFDLAEFASNHSERANLAEKGIAACRKLLETQTNSAPAHYYLAMNLGQLARTRGLSALKLVSEMEREFLTACTLDPHFDYAGPDRNLGQLYRDAPSIASIGSRSKAKKHLQRAVDLAPEYPENALTLIESDLQWSDRNGAKRELRDLDSHWAAARAKFKGPDWSASWTDWDARLKKIRSRIEDPSRAIESPRH
jgi:tetratricopeptide (TPR) repeat protein